MVLTRQEKERLVLDLYNQGKSTREIAEEVRMSFRDIGAILNKAMEEKETSKEQAEKVSQSTQAYKLFSEGKSPVQVAIALNIREPEVAKFYVEYWKLVQLHSLNWVYEQVKDDIRYFVKLYISAKVARMGVEQVVNLLKIANNDLPLVEHKCERLKREVDDLEANKHNSARILQEISDQIATMRKTLDQYQLSCKEERLELTKIQLQKVRLEGLVDNFQNNDEGYVKIRNTAEEKVHSVLSDAKPLLRIALLSLVESIREDPDRYSSLIYHNTSPPADYISQYYSSDSYGQQQQRYPSQDYISMIIEEGEKLYNKLSKELIDESISDCAFSTSSSLPVLSQSGEKNESHPRQTTESIQSHMPTAEHRFVQSDIDNEDQYN
jgi:hypothetical protein